MSQREQVEIERLRRKIAAATSAALVAANNLSDVLDAATARSNLGVTALLATIDAQIAELQGYHGSGFTTGFSSGFRIGPQQ